MSQIPPPPQTPPQASLINEQSETSMLPAWLYPAGFWTAIVLLSIGVLWPDFAEIAVTWLALVPVIAALVVVFRVWKTDRPLSLAALIALAGLVAVFIFNVFIFNVFIFKQWI